MGTTDGKDPLGTFARRNALTAKATSLDTDIAAFRADPKHIADTNGLRDLQMHQSDLLRQAALLPST